MSNKTKSGKKAGADATAAEADAPPQLTEENIRMMRWNMEQLEKSVGEYRERNNEL
jgi:hypothetical protein